TSESAPACSASRSRLPWAGGASMRSDRRTPSRPTIVPRRVGCLVLRAADASPSTLLHLDRGDAEPLGWSSDGTELLFSRTLGDLAEVLYILHADGSETRLIKEPRYNLSAAISPDGSRVTFYSGGPNGTGGIIVVD